ncbi:L-carnitine dehydrogenase [Pseudomonas aeruginosa]|nr:L-carnitine dehydrogenase [Pseudomonas aeruginosa]
MLDVPVLLAAVSPDSPCGDDLEYDAAFLELERIAQGQPERQMGDAVLPAEPPEWPRVRALASELFGRSKDLRVANLLLQSNVALDGLDGLADGLLLVRELLGQYWDGVYPLLDADDDNDPTFRINALTGLVAEPLLQLVWAIPLVRSRAFGPVNLRAALNAAGLQRFASETLSPEQIAGAFADADADALAATRRALEGAQEHALAIESGVAERVGSAQGLDLGPLRQLLRQALQVFDLYGPQGAGEPLAPGAEAALRARVANAWPALRKQGLAPGAAQERLRFVASIEECVGDADFIQESAPERLDLKLDLHARISAAARPDVLIGSSTSGLLPSEFYAEASHPERCLVGHPFNPVYLLPLVEVVGGERTAAEAVRAAMRVYESLGMRPLHVRKEVPGFIADRLLEALWREALHLVNDGVATTGEIDDAIRFGAGLRWSFMGTFLTYTLAGGNAGMRHFMAQFGPALQLPWTYLPAPELTEALIDRVVEGTAEQQGARSIAELERYRDDCLLAVLGAIRETKARHGFAFAE